MASVLERIQTILLFGGHDWTGVAQDNYVPEATS